MPKEEEINKWLEKPEQHYFFSRKIEIFEFEENYDSTLSLGILYDIATRDLFTEHPKFKKLKDICMKTRDLIIYIQTQLLSLKPILRKTMPFKTSGNKRLGHLGRYRLFSATNITKPELKAFIETESLQIIGGP
jgi:hypothetical protein